VPPPCALPRWHGHHPVLVLWFLLCVNAQTNRFRPWLNENEGVRTKLLTENPKMIQLQHRRVMAWSQRMPNLCLPSAADNCTTGGRQGGRLAKSIRISLAGRAAGAALFTGLSLTVLPALAQTGEKIAKAGNAAGAPACVTCHGASGQGQPAAGFPRLAGLNAAYLLRQLQSFHDATRVNPIMAPVAQQLSATDRQALAEYYGGLAVTNHDGQPPADAKSLVTGEALAQRGDWNKGVPACAQCHGPQGLGVGATFPQIAGQSPAYIVTQLQAWQTGTRKNDPMGLMHGIALKLSATDIGAVAVYYGSLDAAPSTKRSVKP